MFGQCIFVANGGRGWGGGEYYSFEVIGYRKPPGGEGNTRWGLFIFNFGVQKPGFGCVVRFKLTSILATNI